jgi:hypothetical protein
MSLETIPGFLPVLEVISSPLPSFLVSLSLLSIPLLVVKLSVFMSYRDFYLMQTSQRNESEGYDFIVGKIYYQTILSLKDI